MIDKELIRKWVADLRSGDYKQCTKGTLKFKDDEGEVSYCCLGVYYCITKGHSVSAEKQISLDDLLDEGPKEAYEIIREDIEEVLEPDELISKNDSGKYSFNDIADYIEEQLENVDD